MIMNRTKIVATIGPSSKDKKMIKGLIEAGMDVARINLNYADYDFCTEIVSTINELNEELDTNVAIMFDIKRPGLNVGTFTNGEATYEEGTKIRVYCDDTVGDETKFSIQYKDLLDDINYDSLIKIDDGHITFQVLDKGKDYLLCKVINGGTVKDEMPVVVPGLNLNMPFLSQKDKKDILLANTLNVDFLAVSFIGNHEDVLEVNDILIDMGNDHMGIIAKIENENALDDIDEIIRVSEGILVARGDLGVQVEIERVPGIQKNLLSKCHDAGKISIVATEMLSSMEEHSTPTRAEVSDVANAVLDGADAVMLTGETTVGAYPVETLTVLSKILASAEEDINSLELMDRAIRTENKDTTGMISYSVAQTANYLKCKAIFAPTMSGYTARKISRFRPPCLIIAASPNIETVKSLQLHFGIYPVLISELKTFDRIVEVSKKLTKDVIEIKEGDKIIVTGGYPFKDVKTTNFMKIEEL